VVHTFASSVWEVNEVGLEGGKIEWGGREAVLRITFLLFRGFCCGSFLFDFLFLFLLGGSGWL